MRFRLFAAASGLFAAGLVLAPTSVAPVAAATPTSVQTCGVPILGDPDSVTLAGPVAGVMGAPLATATVTAAETIPEQGTKAPTVRLFLFRQDGANLLTDLLHGLMGPSTSGTASLSGPATGMGTATETITMTAPGTYTFGFIVLFDNGIHPCLSLDGMHHPFMVTVP